MELMEMVNKVVTALKGDKSLLTAFGTDPVKIVTSILGGNLSADVIKKVVEEVTKQVGSLLDGEALKGAADAAKDVAKDAADGGIIGKIKSLF